MGASSPVRRSLGWATAVVAAVLVLAAAAAAAAEAGFGRTLLIRYVVSRIHHPVEVKGALRLHLFSRNPQVVADDVSIDNPPWMPAGRAAHIGHLTLVLKLPGLGHRTGVIEFEADAATLYLQRDAAGHANWQLTDPPNRAANEKSPIVRSFLVPNAHVVLDDARRHLQFVGTVSASDPGGSGPPAPLRIEGVGQLNGRAVSFALTGDPLAGASHRSPYHFTFTERSSGSHIEGRGLLPQPFAYDVVDAAFEAAGPDLKDLYFLTGVHLIDTGTYHLTGSVLRRGKRTVFSDLLAHSGQSDMRGTVSIDSSSGEPSLDVDLNSRLLRLADLGVRAAGRTLEPKSPLLLYNAMLKPTVLRGRDAQLKFHADQVDVGRLPLQSVSAAAIIDHGMLTVAPLVAGVLGGHLKVHLTLDARTELPAANLDLRITDLQLGQIPHKDTGPPPIEGAMQVQVLIKGVGSSLHQVAASADGALGLQVSHGAVRESLAELTGIDLRGLGLLLARNKRDIPLRCAIGNFKAQAGTLSTQNLIVDTEPVLITGEGDLHLDSEALDLRIRGRPKSLRLFQLRAPILVRGTLAHPSIGVRGSQSVLVVVDRGKAKDVDCTALLAGTP